MKSGQSKALKAWKKLKGKQRQGLVGEGGGKIGTLNGQRLCAIIMYATSSRLKIGRIVNVG